MWLKICCGFMRIFTRLAWCQGPSKGPFSINQEVAGNSLLQHMQHADALSRLAA